MLQVISESHVEHRIMRLINIDRTPRLHLSRAGLIAAGLSLILASVFLSVTFQSMLTGGGSVRPSTTSKAIDPPADNNPEFDNPVLPAAGSAEQQAGAVPKSE